MSKPYHHGNLRESLIRAAQAAVEQGGTETLSLRELAQSLGVSRGAPYRHFKDRRELLSEVATRGFRDLEAAYARAVSGAVDPAQGQRRTARAYLSLAFGRPGLFRLMFDSDLLGAGASSSLLAAAGAAWAGLYLSVAATEPGADDAVIKRRTITCWATLHGFITLVQGNRLRGFMTEPLSEADLMDAILDKALNP